MSKLNVIKEPPLWYAEGLGFECTECGKCCTGSPGYVWVSQNEMQEIADHLGLTLNEFSTRYLRRVNGFYSLLERPKTFDCIFLKDNHCQIYSVRPTQCRTFPWWPQNLKSETDWLEAAKFCEGIQVNAPLASKEIIENQRLLQEKAISEY